MVHEDRSQLLEPFIEATETALAEMAGAEIMIRATGRANRPPQGDDVSAVVDLRCDSGGCLVLTFPRLTAAALAARVFAGVLKEVDADLIGDCVGEIANVVAGQAKALLADTPRRFSIAVPKTVIGPVPELEAARARDCWAVEFKTEFGEFALQLV